MAPSFVLKSPSFFRKRERAGLRRQFGDSLAQTGTEFGIRVVSRRVERRLGVILSFVRRCFCLELSDVDFAQALTALDYIRDLQGVPDQHVRETASKLRILRVTRILGSNIKSIESGIELLSGTIRCRLCPGFNCS
jgi:hypothetical protein